MVAPDFYIPSALYFYKALKVYPAPAELAQIYQKTQPPAVFALVMELISLEYVIRFFLVVAMESLRWSGVVRSGVVC